ncbi:S8 family peptidase [Herbidospora mongoliensis]|uniref:S8 family peptidase n=1 Tax=Herbidospora mongoliensis TaxID=688067 RepID=UPI000A865852|nr:S8/S53 family peptidase [Herbidospora mongoliensis]
MPFTDSGGVFRSDTEAWKVDQLVVDLRYRTLVQKSLTELTGHTWRELDTSPELGLALCELPDLAAIEQTLISGYLAGVRRSREGQYNPDDPIPALDLVLYALRTSFEEKYDGWSPPMAKNRLLDGVQGSPYTGGGRPDELVPAVHLDLTRSTAPGIGTHIGILDSKIVPHPELEGRFLASAKDIYSGAAPHPAPVGHATFVAGVILKHAPDAVLVMRSILDNRGVEVSSWTVAKAMVGFLRTDVRVINMSFGCTTHDNRPPTVLERAVQRLAPSIVLVAAAGNHGRPSQKRKLMGITEVTPVWPAACTDVIAVGARGAEFSPKVPWINVLADGLAVTSTYLSGEVEMYERNLDGEVAVQDKQQFDGYATWSGTSFACAAVVGEIAARATAQNLSARAAADLIVADAADEVLAELSL